MAEHRCQISIYRFIPDQGDNTMKKRLVFSLLLLMAVVPLAFGTTTTINFDNLAGGSLVNTAYAAQGVTFHGVPCSGSSLCLAGATTDVYAVNVGSLAASPLNIVSLFNNPGSVFGPGAFDVRSGAIEADFISPQQTVSIDANALTPLEFLGTVDNTPYLRAFFSNGTNQQVFYNLAPYRPGGICYNSSGALNGCNGGWQTLTIIAPAGLSIIDVRFTSTFDGQSPAMYGRFDNLTFGDGNGTTPGGGGAVPEPTSLSLLGAGLIAFGKAVKNLKK
jgi:hypothetical protein